MGGLLTFLTLIMDVKLTDLGIAKITKHIDTWKLISPYLGITSSEEVALKRDNPEYSQQKRELLFLWRKRKGSKATWSALAEACKEAGEISLYEKVNEMFGGQRVPERGTCFSDIVSDISFQYDQAVDESNQNIDTPPQDPRSTATDYSNPPVPPPSTTSQSTGPNTNVPPPTQYTNVPPHTQYTSIPPLTSSSLGPYTSTSSGQYTGQYAGPSSGQYTSSSYTSQSTSSYSHLASDINPPTGLPFNVYNTDPNTDRPSGISDDLSFNMMSSLHQQPVRISSVNDQPTDSSLSSSGPPTGSSFPYVPPTTTTNYPFPTSYTTHHSSLTSYPPNDSLSSTTTTTSVSSSNSSFSNAPPTTNPSNDSLFSSSQPTISPNISNPPPTISSNISNGPPNTLLPSSNDSLSSTGPSTASSTSTEINYQIITGVGTANVTQQYKSQHNNAEVTSVPLNDHITGNTGRMDTGRIDTNDGGSRNVSDSGPKNIGSHNLHGVFVKNIADINNSISVSIDYANRLLSRGIIDDKVLNHITTSQGMSALHQNTYVSNVVGAKLKVELDPTNTFITVCEILSNYTETREIAIKMMNEAGLQWRPPQLSHHVPQYTAPPNFHTIPPQYIPPGIPQYIPGYHQYIPPGVSQYITPVHPQYTLPGHAFNRGIDDHPPSLGNTSAATNTTVRQPSPEPSPPPIDYSKYSDVSKYGKPTLIEMLNWIVAEDPGIWNEVGSALGISDGRLNGIRRDLSHGGSPKLMFKDVLVYWERSRCKPYNWRTILEALDSPYVEKRSLAEKVIERLDKKAK